MIKLRLVKKSSFIFLGIVLGLVFNFITRIVIVRLFTPNDYGTFTLTLTIIQLCSVISLLGLDIFLARFIPKGSASTQSVISLCLKIVITVGLACSVTLLLLTPTLSNEKLADYLIIAIWSIPAIACSQLIISCFRGIKRTRPSFYFQTLLSHSLIIVLIVVIYLTTRSFLNTSLALTGGYLLNLIVVIIYSFKKLPFRLNTPIDVGLIPEVLKQSLPLLGIVILYKVLTWSDNLLLGYLTNLTLVGIYNSAVPVVHLIPIFTNTANYLYVPILSDWVSKGNIEKVKETFPIVTKWILIPTIPIVVVLIVLAKPILYYIFGPEYVVASTALIILTVGFFLHAVVGPNGSPLIAMEKQNVLFKVLAVSVAVNVVLNVLLIPHYGIIGAAIGTTTALSLRHILVGWYLYRTTGVHPFTKDYITVSKHDIELFKEVRDRLSANSGKENSNS